jgi:hypothetical protein
MTRLYGMMIGDSSGELNTAADDKKSDRQYLRKIHFLMEKAKKLSRPQVPTRRWAFCV